MIFYTHRFVQPCFAATTRGPVIFIRPECRQDTGLLEHERVHAHQWLRKVQPPTEDSLMEQIPQSIINSILGGALAALGWFARQIWDAIKELRTDLAHLREELPTRYVPKDEFHQFSSAVFKKLDRIEDKIDKKLDKE